MQYGNGDHIYELVEGWAQLPDGESFFDIGRVCVDEADTVWVFNRSERPVMAFDPSGARLRTWGEGSFDRPHGMGLDSKGNVYCTDVGAHNVRKFTPDGERLLALESEGEPSETGHRDVPDIFEQLASITRSAGPFNRPSGVTVLDSGEIFVTDGYGNARVHAFDPAGNLLRSWGEPGAGPGEFRIPHAVCHDSDDRIWVADRENSRIQIFDTDGEYVTEWTDLIRPTDLYIDGDTVFVTELCRRVSVFTVDGELLTRWGNAQHPADEALFLAPHTVAVDSTGDIYVGEVPYTYVDINRGERTIRKFERVSG